MKRKKHNPLKRLKTAARIACSNIYAVFVGGEQIQVVEKRTNKVRPFYQDELDAMGRLQHKWSIYIAVIGLDSNGKRYVKGEQLNFQAEYLQGDIAGLTSEYHYKLLDTFNKNHLKNAGWIACANGSDIDPEQALTIFENAKAFEHTVELEEL